MKALIPSIMLVLVGWGCGNNGAPVESQKSASENSPSLHSNKTVTAVRFTPDGKQIVVTSNDATVRLWDAQTGQELPARLNGKTRVWDPSAGQPVLPRYDPRTQDNMPIIGPDNFKLLQDQIDALQKRVQDLEKRINTSGR